MSEKHSEHDHDHGGGAHAHGVNPDADRRWLTIALALILGFMAVEVTVGVIAQSLALISDAAHMLTDAVSIILALIAIRLAARPARGTYTYGLKRAEILSAQANGLSLLLLGGWLAYEAITRLFAPPEVAGGLVLATALAGIVVNIGAAWALSRANRSSLNVEGAFQHILNDLYAFIATAVAGAVMLFTGFARADAIASLIVVALMVTAGIGLLRDSGRILLEAAPAGIDPDAIADELLSQPHVVEVHDLHIWVITSNQPALSAHVLVEPGADCHAVRVDLQTLLSTGHHLNHATLQVDHADDDLHQISSRDALSGHCADPHGPVHRSSPHRH
ncbi:cobalt-zinc-cadmium efflux system protein [Allocatelliglobosispora scoriae]|uniref:Cobalt-zinc-cadmium efflux system protein n=1 Tax=Allocatelliglobosispora scoriae TaxID=643052 RepID=A0A841BMN3_9ACTN|nr:cation diffusion facilitator family transporter [Allocatelliglobosispora scoriae]MBB5868925.1 cobalt-zinc-cadmium efflux system protein [Allocatelliglobosispora scoriae]